MKSFLKGIVMTLVVALVVIVGGAYLLPGEARVERAVTMDATPEKIYAIAGNLQNFNDWSPWYGIDPKTAYAVEGTPGQIGHKATWASNDPRVGKGALTIAEADLNRKLVSKIDMGEMGGATTTLTFIPVDGGTMVTWEFRAPLSGVIDRWMGLWIDIGLGGDVEKGLARLKTLVESDTPDG